MYYDYMFGDIHFKKSFFYNRPEVICWRHCYILQETNWSLHPNGREDVTVIDRLANSHEGYVYFGESCKEVGQVSLESFDRVQHCSP